MSLYTLLTALTEGKARKQYEAGDKIAAEGDYAALLDRLGAISLDGSVKPSPPEVRIKRPAVVRRGCGSCGR